jgi:cytochrome c553
MRTKLLALAAALIPAGAIAAAALAAQTAPTPAPAPGAAPAPDITACQACHGANGISRSPRVPNLAGQQPDYLAAQLRAFRGGTRDNDLMEAVAAQLSDAEIDALARYWNSRPAAPADPHGQGAAGPAISSRMTFPAGFPDGFTLYQSVTANGAITERYVNDVALAAVRAGRPLPDGSVILGVNRAAAGGPATSYAGMEARAGWGAAVPALLRNANWDYALFDANRARNETLNQAPCLACHKPRAESSFVFTLAALRERAARSGD